VGNRCIPLEIDSVINIIEKSELIKALYNIQLIGSINGVSGTKMTPINTFDHDAENTLTSFCQKIFFNACFA
jgi:hypothetical protein